MNKEPWAPDTGALLQTSSGALSVPASAAPHNYMAIPAGMK